MRYYCINNFNKTELIVDTVFVTLLFVGLIYFGYQAYKKRGKEKFEKREN